MGRCMLIYKYINISIRIDIYTLLINYKQAYDHAICIQAKNTHSRVVVTSFLCSLNVF